MGLRYDTVLFDFDGTIMDSGPGIIRCVRDVVDEFGYDMRRKGCSGNL
jgi:phosphoglycolate phosphatase-like HAD superfamily hydrolase